MDEGVGVFDSDERDLNVVAATKTDFDDIHESEYS